MIKIKNLSKKFTSWLNNMKKKVIIFYSCKDKHFFLVRKMNLYT